MSSLYYVTATPTITAGAYSAGDALGGELTFEGMPSGYVIQSVMVIDKGNQDAEIDIFFFSEDFTPTADNAAFAPSAADLENCIGVVNIPAANYFNAGTNGHVAYVGGLSMPSGSTESDGAASSRLKAQMVVRGTPTYTATDDIIIKIGYLPY